MKDDSNNSTIEEKTAPLILGDSMSAKARLHLQVHPLNRKKQIKTIVITYNRNGK